MWWKHKQRLLSVQRLSKNNSNNRYIVRFIFFVIHDPCKLGGRDRTQTPPPQLQSRRILTKIDTREIFGTASPKMIVPTTVDKGVRSHLAAVANDEKIWFPATIFAKSRYQDQIRYGDSENHRHDEQQKRGGAKLKGVAMTSSKNLKCLNQHKNWHGYHFLGWRFQIYSGYQFVSISDDFGGRGSGFYLFPNVHASGMTKIMNRAMYPLLLLFLERLGHLVTAGSVSTTKCVAPPTHIHSLVDSLPTHLPEVLLPVHALIGCDLLVEFAPRSVH